MSMQKAEKELVTLLKQGDALAFDELFEQYGKKLYGFALSYLKTENEAEELVQEVFVRLWENRKSLKPDQTFRSYLFTIALNQIRKYFRKKAIAIRHLSQLDQTDFDYDNQTEEKIDYASTLSRIEQVIEQLPSRKKLIFKKSRIDGKTSKEIAEELNITAGTVDNQVSEAMKIIRETLKGEQLSILLFLALFL